MRRTKLNVLVLIAALALVFVGSQAAAAPRPEQQAQNEQAAKEQTAQDSTIYRVSYRVDEVENGKTINSRSYVLMALPTKETTVRIGSRVPYPIGHGQFQFQNVSMNIDCTLDKQEDGLLVHTTLTMNTSKGQQSIPPDASIPIFGQLELKDTTSATLGKPAFVGSADDVSSNRHYVIEVTVTKAD